MLLAKPPKIQNFTAGLTNHLRYSFHVLENIADNLNSYQPRRIQN